MVQQDSIYIQYLNINNTTKHKNKRAMTNIWVEKDTYRWI